MDLPQYAGLEAIYQRYRGDGLEILGFPCSQFGNQEPGSDSQSRVLHPVLPSLFPMFSKIQVNGDETHPVYKVLKSAARAPGKQKHQMELHEVLGRERWNHRSTLRSHPG